MLHGEVLLKNQLLPFILTVIGPSDLDSAGVILITDTVMDILITDTDGVTHIMDTDTRVTVGDTRDMVVAIQVTV
jgi:hypothetical protein